MRKATFFMFTSKMLTFLVLLWVSFNLSIDMFKGFGSTQKDIQFFILMAAGLELSKSLSLVLSKSFSISLVFKEKVKGALFFLLYILLAIVSMVSAYGFTRTSVEKTVQNTSVLSNTEEIDFYQQKINELQNKIDSLMPQLQRSDLSVYSKKSISSLIDQYTKEQATYFDERSIMRKKTVTQETSKSTVQMYALIAKDLGMQERWVRLFLMLLVVTSVEICLAVMAPHIPIISEVKKEENLNLVESSKNPSKKGIKESFKSFFKIGKKKEKEELDLTEKNQEPITKKKRKYVRKAKPQFDTIIKEEIVNPPNIDSFSLKEELDEKKVLEEQAKEVSSTPVELKNPKKEESSFDLFISALFNNGENTYLRDRVAVSKELAIPIFEINKFFEFLIRTKGSTGFLLIEYRKDGRYYPNYSESYIKALYKEKEGKSAS